MVNVETHNLAVRIYDALNKKGAGLVNASIGIIESVIEESAQQSVHPTVLMPCACGGERQLLIRCPKCGSIDAHS